MRRRARGSWGSGQTCGASRLHGGSGTRLAEVTKHADDSCCCEQCSAPPIRQRPRAVLYAVCSRRRHTVCMRRPVLTLPCFPAPLPARAPSSPGSKLRSCRSLPPRTTRRPRAGPWRARAPCRAAPAPSIPLAATATARPAAASQPGQGLALAWAQACGGQGTASARTARGAARG